MKYSLMQSFKTVIFDFDSTLVAIEGIDELARLGGVLDKVSVLTKQAMNGEVPFDQVVHQRLELIQPQKQHLNKLAQLYSQNLVPGVAETIHELHLQGIQTYVVSGGYQEAILPVTKQLGISSENVFALSLEFDQHGNYMKVNDPHNLTHHNGKANVIMGLNCDRASALIGDGHTDVMASTAVDRFIAFTGVVARDNVFNSTPYVLKTFNQSRLAATLS